MKILGIDPGTTRVGYGFLESTPQGLTALDYGCFRFENIEEASRPHEVFRAIRKLLAEQKPDVVAIEQLFFTKNKKTAMAVSEARGAILVAVKDTGLAFKSYTPSQVRRAVGATNSAGKKGVQKMVRLLLRLKKDPQPDDAADALAVAVCCANERPRRTIHK